MLNFDGYPIKIETTIDFFVKPHFLLVKATMFFLDLLKRALELLSQEINQREYFIKSFSTRQYIYIIIRIANYHLSMIPPDSLVA
jgi:hypothetical protein